MPIGREHSLTKSPEVEPPSVKYVASIRDIDRSAWEACFPGEIEGYDYHLAIESAGLNGFDLGWYAAELDGLLVCAAPVFFTAYDLATTAQGAIQRAIRFLQPFVPGHLTLQLSSLGSPETETCPLGFHPSLSQPLREKILRDVIVFWSDHASGRGARLRGIKDLDDSNHSKYGKTFHRLGFRPATSLPTARMPIDFRSVDGYLARLSAATRKDLRRKLKRRQDVRVEFRASALDYLDDIMVMYKETRERSDWAFEDIPAAYFSEVLARMPERSLLALYFSHDTLMGANLLLMDGTQLVDKFFVMRGNEGRQLNLYFLSWIVNIELCLERGLRFYQSGQASYETKLRLGSELQRNWIYFCHRNPILNLLLRAASPLLAVQQPGPHASHDGHSAMTATSIKRLQKYLSWFVLVGCETGAQLTLKVAADVTNPVLGVAEWLAHLITNKWFILSLSFDIAGFFAWLSILRRHDLSVALPLSSVCYFAITLASLLILKEPVTGAQVFGLCTIGLGVFFLTKEEASASARPSELQTSDPR